jgi:succinate-acetate transporter protein
MAEDTAKTAPAAMLVATGEGNVIAAALRDTTANPAPLGLMAFGLTTVLLNLHNAGFYGMSSMILSMGIFYGGIAQVIAGIMEWKKNNTFGMTAFTSYGLFWLSFVGLFAFSKWIGTSSLDLSVTETALGWYLLGWGVFTGLMFIATLRLNRALQNVFASLTILFVLLAIAKWTGSTTLGKVAGWEGIYTGLSAMYAAVAQIWNEYYGRTVLPMGPYKK